MNRVHETLIEFQGRILKRSFIRLKHTECHIVHGKSVLSDHEIPRFATGTWSAIQVY